MDNNTADVLKNLIEIGGISSVFWAVALGVRWQYGHKVQVDDDDDDVDDVDDEDDDEETDDSEEEESGIIRSNSAEQVEYTNKHCPSVDCCPYRAEFEMRYGLEDRKVLDVAIWYVSVMLAFLFLGFIVGLLLAREQHIMFG